MMSDFLLHLRVFPNWSEGLASNCERYVSMTNTSTRKNGSLQER